jgi:hypothetical protein
MEVVDDDGGKSEEDEVIEAEGDFVPRGPWAGDELGEDVLDDQDDPDEGVGKGLTIYDWRLAIGGRGMRDAG